MNNINNNNPDPSKPIEGISLVNLPLEMQREILSFVNSDVNSESFVNVSEVCKVFNNHVNSGNIKGKNGREYFLNKLEKLNKIDFEYTRKDFYSLTEMCLSKSPELKNLNPNQLENFKKEFFEIVSPYSEQTPTPEELEAFKKAALDNIIEFMSQNKEIKNVQLANVYQNPTSKESQEFIKNFAQKTLEKITTENDPETLQKMNLILAVPGEINTKLTELFNKYAIQQNQTTVVVPQPLGLNRRQLITSSLKTQLSYLLIAIIGAIIWEQATNYFNNEE